MFALIPLLLIGAIVFYVVMVFNGLQRLKTQIAASVQEIGNQLKRQASLIPNLQESAKSYLQHESGIFEMLTKARTAVNGATEGKTGSLDQATASVQQLLPQIKVLVESNPELKADQTVGRFMSELSDTADKLVYARRSLIDLVQMFNEQLLTFPSNLIAQAFGFKPEKGLETPTAGAHLEVSAEETADPKVNLN